MKYFSATIFEKVKGMKFFGTIIICHPLKNMKYQMIESRFHQQIQ